MPFTQTDDDHTYLFKGEWQPWPGVYGILNAKKQIIYVGETDSFKRRLQEHQNDTAHCMHQYAPHFVWAEVIRVGEPSRRQREGQLIAEYAPPCNS